MYIIQYKWNQQLVGGEHWNCVGSVWSHPSHWSGLRLLFSHKALIVANLIFAFLFVTFKEHAMLFCSEVIAAILLN